MGEQRFDGMHSDAEPFQRWQTARDSGRTELEDIVAQIGATYPLIGYAVATDVEYDEDVALDPLVFAGLSQP